jgi:hypothetical protein
MRDAVDAVARGKKDVRLVDKVRGDDVEMVGRTMTWVIP